MKPLLKYRGGKTKELPHILPLIPGFRGRYIEPFFGGGALYFHLEPRNAVINDINGKLIGFYRGVRDNYDTFRRELEEIGILYQANRARFDEQKALLPGTRIDDDNEALYYWLRDMYNGLSDRVYSEAFLYYFINKTTSVP